jgi:hypothetical protein
MGRRRHVLGPRHLGDHHAGDRQLCDHLEVGGVTRVDANVNRLAAPLREQRGEVRARCRLRAGRDAVLEVDDDGVRRRGDRLLDAIGAIGRNVEPGERLGDQTTRSSIRSASSAGLTPSSV